jgi:hypothetical protein
MMVKLYGMMTTFDSSWQSLLTRSQPVMLISTHATATFQSNDLQIVGNERLKTAWNYDTAFRQLLFHQLCRLF